MNDDDEIKRQHDKLNKKWNEMSLYKLKKLS